MGNISDYIAWRGDISFKTKAFNHIDSLVLCQILYAELDTLISKKPKVTTKISVVSKKYFEKKLHKKNLGVLINPQTADFLADVGKSTRFSNVLLCGFENIIDIEQEVQFAAMSALLPTGELCVVFRGTDDTLVGWKEDFSMSYTSHIPSQKYALAYLEKIAKMYRKKIYVMGHSKGGNLAVYASSFCEAKTSKRIMSVFDNDGPGFLMDVCNENCVIENSKRVHAIIPESSIVGTLLWRPQEPTYIESSEKLGISQHDIFSWQVVGTKFVIAEKQNPAGVLTEKTVDTWLEEVEPCNRQVFINEFFEVLYATKAKTLLELDSNWIHSSVAIIRKLNTMDKETKDNIYKIIKIFFHALHINLPPLKDFLLHGK